MKQLVIILSMVMINGAVASNTLSNTKATTTLSSSCVISADTLSFGNYNPSQCDSFSSATIRTKCTKGTFYCIGMMYSNYGIDNSVKYGFMQIADIV